MKKKNGFTLVELLAVIVVLAIIMIIAIPSVLEVMANARKSSFVLYVEKMVKDVQTQYMYDANGGELHGKGYYVYNIKEDLNLTSTGNYEGYILVNASNVDDVQYYVYMWDENYMTIGHNVTRAGMPKADNEAQVQTLDNTVVSAQASSPLTVCNEVGKIDALADGEAAAMCYNREGYQFTN